MDIKLLDTAPRQSIRLDIPGDYFLGTFEATDAEALQELLSLRSVSNCLILVPEPYNLEDAKSWIGGILATQERLLAIPTTQGRHDAFFAQSSPLPLQAIRQNGKPIGGISHAPSSNKPVVEMGYYIHPAHSGKGVMQAAGRKLLQYAANNFGIRKVYASADVCNIASGKIIEKLARETAIGEVVMGSTDLTWPVEKTVEGRGLVSPSTTWSWTIKPDEGHEI